MLFFLEESVSKPAFDDPSMLKTLMEFFNDCKLAPINTHTHHRSVHVDKRFQTCSAIYLRVDRVKKGIEPSYTGPFKVVKKFDKYFTIKTSHAVKNVSLDRLKPAYIADVFNQVNCNNTKTNQSYFLDKPSLVNNISAGSAPRSNSQKPKEDELQTQSESTSTPPHSPITSVSLPLPQPEITRSGRVVRAPNKLNL